MHHLNKSKVFMFHLQVINMRIMNAHTESQQLALITTKSIQECSMIPSL